MNHPPKTLILGTAASLSLGQIKPFCLSLAKAGYRGDLCLFVSDLDRATLEFLQARRVNLAPFQHGHLKPVTPWFTRLSKMFLTRPQQQVLKEQLALGYIHMHCARFAHYRSYLTRCGFNYDHVMLADIRDILFQRDPFDFEIPDGLSVFREDPGKTIGTCFSNSSWIRNGFGEAVLKELYHKPISCSGTTIGTMPAMLDHLARVVPILCAYKKQDSIDQATHNFVLYKCPPKVVHRFENDSGPILTMANVDPARFRFDRHGLLINPSGRVYNTLHQYDRHPELAGQLLHILT
jgi:hypothetical protein